MRHNTLNNKAIFLDRDGVVNKDTGYVYKITEFEFNPGIFEICLHFITLGYQIVILTNQSGIYRNYYTQDDFLLLTNWMIEIFAQKNIKILDVLHCPHGPESNCQCRKPKPGMIIKAKEEHNINLSESWLIGDNETDISAAHSAGIKQTILVDMNKKNKKSTAYKIVSSISEIVKVIKT